jgi:hypothetical protein
MIDGFVVGIEVAKMAPAVLIDDFAASDERPWTIDSRID